jgi:hypothetical protein
MNLEENVSEQHSHLCNRPCLVSKRAGGKVKVFVRIKGACHRGKKKSDLTGIRTQKLSYLGLAWVLV